MKKNQLLRFMGFWPPFLGAGVRIKYISEDFREIQVEMKLRFWNKNYVGTHFGGSLYSMVDPFFMLMLIENLGEEYQVWDKAAAIKFLKPGRGTVTASFKLTEEEIQSIRAQADTQPKVEPQFIVDIFDHANIKIATVEKVLYIRKKRAT